MLFIGANRMNKLSNFLGIGLAFAFFTSGGKAARAADAAGLTGIDLTGDSCTR
jgi:hypothetical protein